MNMKSVHLTSYATARFEGVRSDLVESAKRFGFENIHSHDEAELKSTDFYTNNKTLLDEVCGAGFWVWKPFFILQDLEKLKFGEVLFYCDAGCKFLSSPAPLIKIALEAELVLFDARPLKNRQFTKRACFTLMACDSPQYHEAHTVIATTLIIKKTQRTVDFIKEWLSFCINPRIVDSSRHQTDLPELSGFLQHRCDQAVLSLLACKHKINTFRNPSKWGNYLKPLSFRVTGEYVGSPYGLPPKIKTYAKQLQENSPYGEILEFNRLPNMLGKQPLPVSNQTTKKMLIGIARRIYRSFRSFSRLKGKTSYAQCGEDVLVDYVFRLRGIQKPSYLDIGANHPVLLSNTAIFYKRGCRGINIDANPSLLPAFHKHRPADINLNVGIGSSSGVLPFFVIEDPTLSTFSEEEAKKMQKLGHQLKTTIQVPLKSVNDILVEYCNGQFPDFLSLDVEGLDLDILRSIDYTRSRPKIICVEAAEHSPTGAGARRDELIEFLKSNGYFEYANTNLNAIMVLKEFWFI